MDEVFQRVFVTGGSGFIGSHLVRQLVNIGSEVVNFDLKPPSFSEDLGLWVQGDILDGQALKKAAEDFKPTAVIHLAARAELKSNTLDAYASITTGTVNVLSIFKEISTVQRFLHTSTQYVVGPGIIPTEDEKYIPYTLYGKAKAIAEQTVRSANPNFSWVVIRPTGIWGPLHPSFAFSTWKYIEKGVYLLPRTKYEVLRGYGFVKNTVDQIIALGRSEESRVNGKTFYLGDEVIDASIWVDGFSYALRQSPCHRSPEWGLKLLGAGGDMLNKFGLSFPFDSGRAFRLTTPYPVDLDPIKRFCGQPKISLEEGIEETVDWLRALK